MVMALNIFKLLQALGKVIKFLNAEETAISALDGACITHTTWSGNRFGLGSILDVTFCAILLLLRGLVFSHNDVGNMFIRFLCGA
jgi:hypothetical protein